MGIFDPLRRAVGIATAAEIEKAEAERSRMVRSGDPSDRFGVAFANAVGHLDAKSANAQSKAVRESDVEWPSDPHLRWNAAARIGARYGRDLIGRRLSTTADPALAEAVNAHALGEAASEMGQRRYDAHSRTSVEDVLRQKADGITDAVHAYISYGRVSETNARAQTTALAYVPNEAIEARLRKDVSEFMPGPAGVDRQEWIMEATRTRMAMARQGLLSPAATVQAALDARDVTQMRLGAIATIDRETADKASPDERMSMLDATRRETFILTYGSPVPGRDATSKDAVLLGVPSSGRKASVPMPALGAAMAARRAMAIS